MIRQLPGGKSSGGTPGVNGCTSAENKHKSAGSAPPRQVAGMRLLVGFGAHRSRCARAAALGAGLAGQYS